MEKPTFFCAACGFESMLEFNSLPEAVAFYPVHMGANHEGAIHAPMLVADLGAEPWANMPPDILESSFNQVRTRLVSAGVEQGSPIPQANLLLALITEDYSHLVVYPEVVETVVEAPDVTDA